MPNIKHIAQVMPGKRSFDNFLGWWYEEEEKKTSALPLIPTIQILSTDFGQENTWPGGLKKRG